MFRLVGLISGLRSVGASLTECSTSSGKFISGGFSKTGELMYKRSWVTLSVTSRREILTSRRQFLKLSVTSRREISRRDVQISSLCHVATWIFTSRRHFNTSLSRRDVYFHVATSKYKTLCHVATWPRTSRRGPARRDVAPHVATWPRTSRRHLVMSSATSRRGISCVTWAYLLSVTSRRDPARRDVALVLTQE